VTESLRASSEKYSGVATLASSFGHPQPRSRDEAVISRRQNVVSCIDGDHVDAIVEDAVHTRSSIPGVGPGNQFLMFSERGRFSRPDHLSVCDPLFSAPFVEHPFLFRILDPSLTAR